MADGQAMNPVGAGRLPGAQTIPPALPLLIANRVLMYVLAY